LPRVASSVSQAGTPPAAQRDRVRARAVARRAAAAVLNAADPSL